MAKHFMDDFGRKMDVEIKSCSSFRGTTVCSDKFKTVVSTIGKGKCLAQGKVYPIRSCVTFKCF